MDPQLPKPQGLVQQNFSWLYPVLTILLLVLSGLVYFLVIPYFSKPLDLSVQIGTSDTKINIKRLSAPSNGFLVVNKDENGLPGAVVGVSPFLIKDTYPILEISIPHDIVASGEKMYVTFRTDEDHNNMYDYSIDTEIPRNIYGYKLRLEITGGVAE